MTDDDLTNCIPSEPEHEAEVSGEAVVAATNTTVAAETQNETPFVLKPPSINSKIILQNMEEVLNTVKKQHRQKHRRRKEQKRLRRLAEGNLSATDEHDEDGKKHKSPLSEKCAEDNTKTAMEKRQKSAHKSPLKKCSPVEDSASILRHFQRTPRKRTTLSPESVETVPAKPKLTNAFEFMMNARNRANEQTPKQESAEVVDSALATNGETPSASSKRKTALLSLVERKRGKARSREEEDEARGEYIEQQLEQRAKRFKKMLTQPEKTTLPKENKITTPAKQSRRNAATVPSSNNSFNGLADQNGFLTKLSPPQPKANGGLFGYFPKIETPNAVIEPGVATAELEASPKLMTSAALNTPTSIRKRGRPRKEEKRVQKTPSPQPETASVVLLEAVKDDADSALVSNGRPRRSCAGKARYDYDLSPGKAGIKTKTPTATKNKAKEDESVEVIELDDTIEETTTTQSKKLAPLFVRQMPKPTEDLDVLRARKEFLLSGVPDKLKEAQIRKKVAEVVYVDSFRHFPSVSHVQQLSDEERESLEKQPAFRLKLRELDDADAVVGSRARKSKGANKIFGITDCSLADFQAQNCKSSTTASVQRQWSPLPVIENKRDIIKSWKLDYEPFLTYKCYNQMREKYRHFSAVDVAGDVQVISESFLVTRHSKRTRELPPAAQGDDDIAPPVSAPNGELLFTDKYKPYLFEQILVNYAPVQKLRDFLAQWNTSEKASDRAMIDDDFSDSSMLSVDVNSAMVLLGPPSSGKTNAVFALANEMNFNVLEINAGMKRTGKRLIQDLLEATQSHQIRKDKKACGAFLPAKKKSPFADTDATNVRKSLILIEDADVIFEQRDHGFVEAMYTLAQTSKRPVIIVASNPSCSHLQRLIQQNCIKFKQPHVQNICKFLSVLALVENCPLRLDDLISLYLFNDKNLRKTLLELQFYVQSGGDGRGNPSNQRQTPKKSGEQLFCASPSKRNNEAASVERENREDEKLTRQREVNRLTSSNNSKPSELELHSTLFEFYSCKSGEAVGRVPFPVNFNLLSVNLSEIFRLSARLLAVGEQLPACNAKSKPRKSRSPKKVWLKNATTGKRTAANGTPLGALCEFYENLSIACLLDSQGEHANNDYLAPTVSRILTHSLVEKSLDLCLEAAPCPYNLFDTPPMGSTLRLTEQLNHCQLRTAKATALDYEPVLRAICRNEKTRLQADRRSSRFYHYLRSYVSSDKFNFNSPEHEMLCDVFQADALTSDEKTQTAA